MSSGGRCSCSISLSLAIVFGSLCVALAIAVAVLIWGLEEVSEAEPASATTRHAPAAAAPSVIQAGPVHNGDNFHITVNGNDNYIRQVIETTRGPQETGGSKPHEKVNQFHITSQHHKCL
jgi:hypothetical protein